MNSNREICIIAHMVIIKCVVLLYSGICHSSLEAPMQQDDAFGLLHDLWALKHYSTYKLVMYLAREICRKYLQTLQSIYYWCGSSLWPYNGLEH